jgi:uncharacterized membrane protein (UPF0127 family)
MNAVNLTNQRELASNLREPTNIFGRLRGLLGESSLPPGEGLLIKPCNSIHTFGMRFSIDVIFLNNDNHVVAVSKNLRPNRMTRLHLRAKSVIELPAGTIDGTATEIGHKVGIIRGQGRF